MVDRGCFKQQEIQFLDERITIKARVTSKKLPNFAPCNWSVICGRGKECYNHVGNRRLRVLVEANLPKYSATKSKFQKTIIVSSIVDAVRSAAQTGGFVRQNPKTKEWVEVGDDVAREKIGQMLREALMRKDTSKLNARKEKRRAQALKKKSRQAAKSVSDCSSDETSCTSGSSSSDSSVADSISTAPATNVATPAMPTLPGALVNKQLELASRMTGLIEADPLPFRDLNPMAIAIENPYSFAFPDLTF